MTRPLSWLLAACTTLFCSACISISDPGAATELARMSDQAKKTCGEGNVKEVSTKSFSCK